MSNLAHHPGLGLTRGHFDISQVHSAVNPNPLVGYAHGPIPNNNIGWKPQAWHDAIAAGLRKYDIKAGDIANADNPPPNPLVLLNKENSLVCDILVDGSQTMCGLTFEKQPAFRRHLRNEHSGATFIPDRRAKTALEMLAGQNALKKWVLTGGWRDAMYLNEPGRGPETGPIGHWCDALERIAREDADFRRQFGSRFHRFQQPTTPTSGNRSRRRGRDPPPNPVPFPSLTAASEPAGTPNASDHGDDEEEQEEEETDAGVLTENTPGDEEEGLESMNS
ncbi:hypothetical protein NUU61_009808 [Penicillium alfredii]|uniref:Uncharacterized protein n=1 Tax=Penicillium alfredii TaxID=1506179 RepID=A0A9W9EGW3_9EURO|nr:uncharacterized protein NUU61_009808 [Penicillium alfredii]KAJ5081544.1 hypothetical protein NUU61_009808 [Penicillium alfredii]